MTDLLIVVDMQRDFVTGALGTAEAAAIVPAVAARIRRARQEGTQVLLTLDTHEEDYRSTPRRAAAARAPLHPRHRRLGPRARGRRRMLPGA